VRWHRELCNRASLHVVSRERFVLPAWQRAGWKNLSSDTLVAYVNFKRALAELLVCPPGKPGFAAALHGFLQAVAQQRIEDEQVLMPALRKALDVADRRTVFNDIEALYENAPVRTDEPASPEPGQLSVHALLDEAQVVLSSLPNDASASRAS